MRFRWSDLARWGLIFAAAVALGRALTPSDAQLAARAASSRETPSVDLRRLFVALAASAAALALVAGAEVYQRRQQTLAVAQALFHADPWPAPALMIRYGCAGCHTISGVPGADGQVGPELKGLRARVYVGGVARNDAADIVRWIVDPPSLSPRTAMPRTGVNEDQARAIAAWLYAH